MKTAVLLTTHYWHSKRKAGFHWIADSLWRSGWNVYFVTAITWLDKIKGDYRFHDLSRIKFNRPFQEKERFYGYIWWNAWRPVGLRNTILNRGTYKLFAQYNKMPLGKLRDIIKSADIIIYESIVELMFFERLKKLNPNAKFVYRVSDDLHRGNIHPVILDAEKKFSPFFDLISVPTTTLFEKKFSLLPNAQIHPHGLPFHLYDRTHSSPYQKGTVNAIFTGNLLFDMDFLERASLLFPNVLFHIIGDIAKLPKRENIFGYGEMPYEQTIPFIKFATIGLNPLTVFSNSNKVMQYTYCRLPIVTSSIHRNIEPHVFYYEFGDAESIRLAMDNALTFDHQSVPANQVTSWDELTNALIG